MRLSNEFVTKVDAWAAAQDDHPGRTEAIRRLVEMSLKSVSAPKPTRNVARSARAAELAAKAIDKLGDPAASTEERDERRRRLTKGPPVFREDRADRPKVTNDQRSLWSTEEDERLGSLARAGFSLTEIAHQMQRRKSSVRTRATKLMVALARDRKSMQAR